MMAETEPTPVPALQQWGSDDSSMSDVAQDRFEENPDAAPAEAASLPFAFARRFGAVITDADLGPDRVELVSKGPAPADHPGRSEASFPAETACYVLWGKKSSSRC